MHDRQSRGTGEWVRGLRIALLVALCGAVALALVGCALSEDKYKEKLEDYGKDYSDASSDWMEAITDVLSKDGALSADDAKDANKKIDDAEKEMKKAASQLKGLWPPSKYKDFDKALEEMLDVMQDKYIKRIDDDVVSEIKKDAKPEDIQEAFAKLGEDEDFLKAMEEASEKVSEEADKADLESTF